MITKRAVFLITPLYIPKSGEIIPISATVPEEQKIPEEKQTVPWGEKTPQEKITYSVVLIAIIVGIIIVLLAILSYFGWIKYNFFKLRKSVLIKRFGNSKD